MNDPVAVKIVKSMHQLLSDFSHLRLRKISVILQNFEELTLCKLCDNAKLMGCFKWVKQQYYIFMIQAFQYLNFLSEIIQLLLSFTSTQTFKQL